MKVLVVTPSYPTPDDPINGIFVREHALAAAGADADVSVLHIARGYPFGLERVANEPLPTWRSGFPHRPAALGFVAAGYVGLHRMTRPDVVHAHFFLAADIAVLFARAPVVTSEHWAVFFPEARMPLSPPLRAAARFGLGRSDRVLPVSRSLGQALRANGIRTPFTVVPNAVDETLFRAPGSEGGHRTPPRLLTVGRLSEQKGIDVLISAMAALPKGTARLEIVGDGPDRGALEQLAERLGVAEDIEFSGLLSKTAVAARMQHSDLFVLASRFESNGVVVLEALACGVPVVATSIGPLTELVDGSNGVLAPPEDAQALATAISGTLDRLHEFDHAAISATAHRRYGRAAVGRQLVEVYERARAGAS